MQLREYALPDCVPGVACTIAAIVAATILIAKLSRGHSLHSIPTVGSSSWLGSWWAGPGHKFRTNATEIIREGYEKYKTAPFKVANSYRWTVILGGREHIEEVRMAPDDVLSLHHEGQDLLQLKYTMIPEVSDNLYHIEIIRSHITRNFSSVYPGIRDEVSVAFDEVLDLKDNEWKTVHALSAIQKVVCRTSNRLFVGSPLCQDNDWIDINVRYTLEVAKGAYIIRCFPGFLAPLIARFTSNPQETLKRAMTHLGPIIEERLKLQATYGNDWTDKPNDLLSWLLEKAPEGPERTVRLLTARVLSINFAAIHTTSNSFFQALFFLAENPEYIQPLREEVESIVEKEGWSKSSLGKMRKIDSFLKESQRLVGNSVATLMRKAMKDFTFSDGTFIPKGTSVAAPAQCLHLDNEYYDNAHVFDPFRFSNMRDEEGNGTKHHFVTTSTEFLPFGHGKYACPGRFFAVNELKSMLAHVVMTYDVKLQDDKTRRPKELGRGIGVRPDPAAKIVFRRRAH